jgi:hypothetical protein
VPYWDHTLTADLRNEKLVEIAQEILQGDELRPLGSEFVRPGLCQLLTWASFGRSDIAAQVIERGYMQWAVATLRARDPDCSWVACAGQPDALPCAIVWTLADIFTSTSGIKSEIDTDALILQSGIVDLLLDMFKAHQKRGSGERCLVDVNCAVLVWGSVSSQAIRQLLVVYGPILSRLLVVYGPILSKVACIAVDAFDPGLLE